MTKLYTIIIILLVFILGTAYGKYATIHNGITDIVSISEYEHEVCIDGVWHVYMNEPIHMMQ